MRRDDPAAQAGTIGGERAEPGRFGVGKWLLRGHRLDREPPHGQVKTHPWYQVLWLSGVDYFSTLGYQPAIALLAAGALAPLATVVLVAVTIFGAVPVYVLVARRSYVGQGSIAMLENLLGGWWGKLLVLTLLGFAATDFVITMTLSAADAAKHAIENPYLHPYLGDAQIGLTLALLTLLAAVFWIGFTEAIGFAAAACLPFLALSVLVLFRALIEIVYAPELLRNWRIALTQTGDWSHLAVAAVLVFPRLALGLSGFETGVSVMPLIRGDQKDTSRPVPHSRIRNTRKLLITAALIMSVLLLVSSLVTSLLVPPEEYQIGGKASGRAIAYVAHELLGNTFGTIYDISTIVILWFAGASAMAALLHLVPRYLPRFGMAPRWVAYPRPLILVLLSANLIVTLVFRAEVEAQAGAYATGVLVLILSGAFAVALALWREAAEEGAWSKRLLSVYCWGIAVVFLYTLVENALHRPDGLIIAAFFISVILLFGAASRSVRSIELRVRDVEFSDTESAALWKTIKGRRVDLAPMRTSSPGARARKRRELLGHYTSCGPLAFLHVTLLDNRSEFLAPLVVRVKQEGDDYLIEVSQAIALANTIAVISELIDPVRIFLGLTRKNLMRQALRYILFGEGETAFMVYTILLSYWERTPEEDVRPLIFLMSD